MAKAGSSIVLGYIGVHQIFQLALAAHESGELDTLYCSVLDRPGKWGGIASRFSSAAMLRPLGADQLPAEKVRELPWAMICRKLPVALKGRSKEKYLSSNRMFSRAVAKRLPAHSARIIIAAESCALECFEAGRRLGMTCVLDCPGIPQAILSKNIEWTRTDLGIKVNLPANHSLMEERKHCELELADHVMLCSDLQRSHLLEVGRHPQNLTVNPLWVDDCFWDREPAERLPNKSAPLRVLYAGPVSVAKGVPYLLNAHDDTNCDCRLTLCGTIEPEVAEWAGPKLSRCRLMPRVRRQELPRVFSEHDVLVLPSMGDSFGFVALEAMACGLPVIVTDAVGVPVPDPAWKVPVHSAHAISTRILKYAHDRDLLASDSQSAFLFARAYTAEAYRRRARELLLKLLS